MALVGEYSDTLRAVGRFLDDIQAFGITVVDEGENWLVTWDGPGSMAFHRFALEALRDVARGYRGLEGDLPRFTTSQILRILGAVLDRLNSTSFSIREMEDGYRLSALVGENVVDHTYSLDEIHALLDERLRAR